MAVSVLAAVGRAESIEPVLKALDAADPAERIGIACALPELPADPRTLVAFKRTLESMPPDVKLSDARDARVRLAHCAAGFFDPSVVPWLANDARRLHGSEDLVQAVREAEFVTMLKMASPNQKKHLDAVAKLGLPIFTLGDQFKTAYTTTTNLFVACGDRMDCWLDKLTDPAAQSSETPAVVWLDTLLRHPEQLSEKQFQVIKAGYMGAALGGADAKQKLLAAAPKLSPMAMYTVADAIDRLTRQGDPATAAALQTMLDAAAGDRERQKALVSLRIIADRLQALKP